MAVREGLLVLLAEGPRHGYELKTEFEQRTGSLWQINTGQVYTTLDRLLRDGLVEPVNPTEPDRRRPYQLTSDGERAAQEWLAARIGADAPPRDELIMKVLLAAHSDLAQAYTVIDSHRHELLAQLQEVRRRQREAPDTLASRLCSDALIVRLEGDLRWLDLCSDRLAVTTSSGHARGNG